FFHGMLERGVYLPPAPFEAIMISLAHSNADLHKTVAAFESWCRSDRHS
ncbi:MAG TPA: aspartate aminotransferase family protein, partial [Candidatus Binatia bacterium]|nr:aspartate aminotransferase family protein [Candidatus Binatia bacterium]